jgi:hypothetical protein
LQYLISGTLKNGKFFGDAQPASLFLEVFCGIEKQKIFLAFSDPGSCVGIFVYYLSAGTDFYVQFYELEKFFAKTDIHWLS